MSGSSLVPHVFGTPFAVETDSEASPSREVGRLPVQQDVKPAGLFAVALAKAEACALFCGGYGPACPCPKERGFRAKAGKGSFLPCWRGPFGVSIHCRRGRDMSSRRSCDGPSGSGEYALPRLELCVHAGLRVIGLFSACRTTDREGSDGSPQSACIAAGPGRVSKGGDAAPGNVIRLSFAARRKRSS